MLKKFFVLCISIASLLHLEGDARAQCSPGRQVGRCADNRGEVGCCDGNNAVSWCDGQALCELNCLQNAGSSGGYTNSCCNTSTTLSPGCCDITIQYAVCQYEINNFGQTLCCNEQWYWDSDCVAIASWLSNNCAYENCSGGDPVFCGWDSQRKFLNCSATPVTPAVGESDMQCGGGCVPSCNGIECGSDGCNGSCGACGPNETCSEFGTCISMSNGCTPRCAGRDCGDDGCGGSCGSCLGSAICNNGRCALGQCTSNCVGKSCGDDGCGGSCGSCSAEESCDAGVCASGPVVCSCQGRTCGDDGCGRVCGYCGPGTTCDITKYQCIDAEPAPNPDGDVGGVVPEECPAGRIWNADVGQCLALSGESLGGGDDGGCAGGGTTNFGVSLIMLLGALGIRRRVQTITVA